ncbi:glucose-6-phosphate dehydrogenase [Methylobacterium isbiliense]|uniref:Glucose-6-phosphate 1-dehydrogenase n=1 Tax=Methylobacterium isbiliense TaxID=315478 RepID=A0ABQ4SAX2_9HYPH|nr:glucose-6-phosphate dehydrogenase [Methylobacterium isbiliense]MDN3621875.1 glucose-6-phosphate dehydrogenase [Methylobacterium isbiliense]GJD99610.1 Glucose-6-phosphate 1-dehydrogenase 2 [Methylobacterium isbiliense]
MSDRTPRTDAAPAPDCTLVIFGATGDLTHRLLMPALYNLARWKLLPARFAILGVSRSAMSSQDYRSDLTERVRGFIAKKGGEAGGGTFDEAVWSGLADRISYMPGDLADPETFAALKESLAQAPGGGSVLFYLAVAASLFGPTVRRLGEAGLLEEPEGAWRRVIIEKPFGHDLDSARALNREIRGFLAEEQIFRIDHFLGKETVQNIMAFRFGNGMFEPLWNRDHICHVQITVAETVGVEGRGRFYEATGALRDMVPNHLFQLFTLVAMEPPVSFAAEAVRDKKQEVLLATPSAEPEAAVRGQYAAGRVQGRPVGDYRHEPDVAGDSRTETFVALRLAVDNWRWAGVPFYLRTGKAMARRDTEIAIRFKPAPLALFRGTGVDAPVENWLLLQLQPDEGISLQFGAKIPGPKVRIDTVDMRFCYKDHFKVEPSTGYETLIYDAMIGDSTLFQRADMIEEGWRVVQPILDAQASEPAPYAAGSAGPAEADDLLAREGRAWRPLHEA